MKKSLLLSVICLVGFLGSNIALGQESKRIGVIDLQRCFRESTEGQNTRVILQKKKDDLQKQLDDKEKELLELQKEFSKQAMMLSMDAQEDKRKIIDRKKRELEYSLKDFNIEMRRAQDKEEKRVLEELTKIVEKIGSDEGYLVILETRMGGVVYWNETYEITDKVIKAYNEVKKGAKK